MSIESRKEVMKELLKERDDLLQQINETEAAIKGLRKICRHRNPDGTSAIKFKNSDSHRHYYECDICFEQIQE